MKRACAPAPAVCAGIVIGLLATSTYAVQSLLDFETDDLGIPLANGQSISTFPDVQDAKGNVDTVFEFGNLVNVSTTHSDSDGHEGAAIFDSTPGLNYADTDLWVDKGNILSLPNDDHPATVLDPTYGLRFTRPDDEKSRDDRGSIVFDFNRRVELTSIDLIAFVGGSGLKLILTDATGDQRVYNVPGGWTTDVRDSGVGWHTLMLNTLDAQPAEPSAIGGDVLVARNDSGFVPADVIRLEVVYATIPCSGGIDNLTLSHLPEPVTLLLFALGGVPLYRRGRR